MFARMGLDILDIDRQIGGRKPGPTSADNEVLEYECWRRRALAARCHISRERAELLWWIEEQQDDDLRSILRDLVDEFGDHEPCEGADCSACWVIWRAVVALR